MLIQQESVFKMHFYIGICAGRTNGSVFRKIKALVYDKLTCVALYPGHAKCVSQNSDLS